MKKNIINILIVLLLIIFVEIQNLNLKNYYDVQSNNAKKYTEEQIQNIEIIATNTDAELNNLKSSINEIINEEIEKYMNEKITEENDNISEENNAINIVQNTNENVQSDGVLTSVKGVNYYNGQKETYYNLDMSSVINNAKSIGIEGEYWIREDGVKMYGNYIIVAANLDVHPRGSIVETSLGIGIVLDTGGFAASNPNQLDIATDW